MKRYATVPTWQLILLVVILPLCGWMAHRSSDESQRIMDASERTVQATHLVLEGHNSAAVAELEKALAADPTRYEAYRDLSGAYFSVYHDRALCIAVYRRALLFLPQDGRVHDDLARLFYLHGDYDNAIGEFETAQSLLGHTPEDDAMLARAKAQEAHLSD